MAGVQIVIDFTFPVASEKLQAAPQIPYLGI
jgi:hypothetical protein